MKKITLLSFLLFFLSITQAQAQPTDSETESVCVSGSDDDPLTITLTPSDLTVNQGQQITAVSVSSATLGNPAYWGDWYDATITVTGGVSDGSAVTIANMAGLDLTGFTSITMTSEDLDAWSDSVTMCLNLSVTWELPIISADESVCVSGSDDDPLTITLTPSDLTVNQGQQITAVSVSSATLGNPAYWGDWYDATITVTGGVSDGSAVTIANMAGLDLTGFTSITMTSEDLDAWSDSVTMCLILGVTYVEPLCISPSDITFSNITASSADVSWTTDDSSFNVEVVDVTGGGTATGTATYAGVTNPYSLTGLSSNNDYEVYVQTDCGAGDTSAWAGPVSFTTECSAVSDFSENFDSVTTPNLPNCWSSILDVSSSFASVETSTGADSSLPNGVLLYNSSSTSGDIILVSPELSNLAGGTHRLKLDATNSNSTQDLEIGTLSDPTDGSTFTLIETVDLGTTFLEYIIDFSTYSGNDNYIGFRRILSSSTYSYVYLDNIVWEEIPSCLEPLAPSAASITASSAELSWIAGDSETLWNIEVVDVTAGGTATGTATYAGVTNPYSLTGLSSNNEYEVYVQADCGAGDTSAWAGPVSFTTVCDAISSFPWTEDFESVTTPALPSCFSELNNNSDTDYWKTYSSYGTSSSKAAGMFTDFNAGNNDDYLILPQFTLTGNERLKYSVRAQSSGEPNDYKVVLSTTGNSAADFTTDLMALTTVSSESHEENIINLSAYSGDVYIAIHIPSGGLDGWYIYFDDFTVEALPSCSAPTAITSSSITTSSAELSWIAGDSETLWNIEVVDVTAGGTATGTATYAGVTNPYSLTGLSSNNEYEVYVQADCGSGETSAWAGPVSFTTEPAPIVPNYANDFSTFPGEFWSQGIGALNAGPAGSTSEWTSEVFGNSGVSGAAYVNVYYSSFYGGNLDWLISPMFDLSSGNHYLNFNVALTSWNSTSSTTFAADDFVTLMVSEDNGSTWSELYRWDSNNSPSASGDAIPEIDLSSYTSMTKFAFYAESNAGNIDNDFFIDDFQITTTSLGIEEASISQFTYFPNPVNDVLTINSQKVVEDITVFNMLGQVVRQQTPNTMDCTVDLSAMQTGAYFVQVSIGNTVETVRILKN